MKEKHIIAAVAEGNGIGYNGDLLWRIPLDLRRFKTLTIGNIVIMGRKTFESIGSKPLKDRNNIVVSSKGIEIPNGQDNLFCVGSLKDAYELAETISGETIFVIGGGKLYAESLPYTDVLDITYIYETPKCADTFFPDDLSDFEITWRDTMENQPDEPKYEFRTYKNKKFLNRF